jgi:hypothetical protein
MVRSAIALILLLGCAAAPTPAPVRAAPPTSPEPSSTYVGPTYVPASEPAAASRVPEKWCRGLKPPAVAGALNAVDVELDDALAIVARMHERTDMPVMSITKRNGLVRAMAECCPTRYRGDCGTLIVEFGKQNGVWTAIDARELPGE